MEVDVLPERLKYFQMSKKIRIYDPYLAMLHWTVTGMVLILFTGVYQCLYLHAYASFEQPTVSWSTWTIGLEPDPLETHPQCNSSDPYYHWSRDSASMSDAEYAVTGGFVSDTATCIETSVARHVRTGDAQVSVSTFEFVGGQDNVTTGNQGEPRYYVREPESVRFGHLVSVAVSWMSEGARVYNTKIFDYHGNVAREYKSESFLSFTTKELLQYAAIDLDAKNVQFWMETVSADRSPTFRLTGINILMLYECKNLRPFDFATYGEIVCDISFHPLYETWGTLGSRIVAVSSGGAEGVHWRGEAEHTSHTGVVISFASLGAIGRFDTVQFVRVLIDAVVLTSTANMIIVYLATHVLPGRRAFAATTIESAHLNTFSKQNGGVVETIKPEGLAMAPSLGQSVDTRHRVFERSPGKVCPSTISKGPGLEI
eukprot:Rmarinus@m.27676